MTVRPPLRIAFSALKSISGMGLNKMDCTIYGLKESSRDIFQKDVEQQKLVNIQLKIGYQGDLKTIFSGQLHRGNSKLTSNGYETAFQCLDGGYDFFHSFTSRTVAGKDNAIDSILGDMPNTEKGKVTKFQQLARPKVLMGNSYNLLRNMVGENESIHIEKGRVNILKDNEVIKTSVPLIDAESGLIDTPERESGIVTFTSVLNPFIVPAGKVNLVSAVAKHLNGFYKVDTIGYKGDTEGTDWNQKVTCLTVGGLIAI